MGKILIVVSRLTEGSKLIIRSEDGKRELNIENWSFILLPIIAGLLFVIAVNVSGGYLLQAVVEEKENRTMELLVTSVSPEQLMAGKIVGNLSVGLFELLIWTIFTVIALKILPNFIPMGEPPEIPFSYVLLIIATFLPAFVMIAAAMGALGATATEMKEAQQVAGFFTIPIVIPYWFITAIMFNPNGGIAVGLSLFPLTAPLALPMRAVFTTVPTWQFAVSISMLILLAVFAVWLAGRVFRLGMLRYGKRIHLKEAFQQAPGRQAMKKTLIIFKNELVNVITRRSFLITLFLLPLIGIVILFVITTIQKSSGADPMDLLGELMVPKSESSLEGYVDQSGLVKAIPPGYEDVLVGFTDESGAKEALDQGKISAYYIIEPDYIDTGNVIYVRPDFNPMGASLNSSPVAALMAYALTDGDIQLTYRVQNPMNVTKVDLGEQPTRDQNNPLTFFLPYIVTFLFYGVILASSTLMLEQCDQ